jgi:hypothetical protein
VFRQCGEGCAFSGSRQCEIGGQRDAVSLCAERFRRGSPPTAGTSCRSSFVLKPGWLNKPNSVSRRLRQVASAAFVGDSEGEITMKRWHLSCLVAVGFAALLYSPSPALAQIAPPLGVLQQFSVLGGSAVSGSAGAGTLVAGDVGSRPTDTINNFPPSSVTAGFFVRRVAAGNGPLLIQARNDATTAFNFLGAPQGAGVVIPDNLAGQTLTTGVYDLGAALLPAGGTLTLNGAGIFVFRTASTLTTVNTSTIAGTANPCNVYWQVGSSATIDSTNFSGNVFASASVTVTGDMIGRAIAGTGAVTMPVGGNTIGGCATPGAPAPTLPEVAAWGLLLLLLGSGAYLLSRRTPTEASR